MYESESEVPQLCPTLSDPMDCNSPGSSIHGIFQARALEWGAIAFSKQYTRVPFSLHPHRHLLLLVFLLIAILTGVRWYLIMVLICISLMINDVEHLFRRLLGICVPPPSAYFLIGLFGKGVDTELYKFFVYFGY